MKKKWSIKRQNEKKTEKAHRHRASTGKKLKFDKNLKFEELQNKNNEGKMMNSTRMAKKFVSKKQNVFGRFARNNKNNYMLWILPPFSSFPSIRLKQYFEKKVQLKNAANPHPLFSADKTVTFSIYFRSRPKIVPAPHANPLKNYENHFWDQN